MILVFINLNLLLFIYNLCISNGIQTSIYHIHNNENGKIIFCISFFFMNQPARHKFILRLAIFMKT